LFNDELVDLEIHRHESMVKLPRAYGGYLGTQRRRRTRLPAKHFGELEVNIDPKISEWGNPTYCYLNP
jgi:hypothetical protein